MRINAIYIITPLITIHFVKCLQFIIGRMGLSIYIRLLLCMAVFLPCCIGFQDPCKSQDRQILDLCELGINYNFSFSFDIFLHKLNGMIIV